MDFTEVVKAAVRNKVVLEINSQQERMDLKDVLVKQAKEMGAKFAIDNDAHSIPEIGTLDIGVSIARRGWLEPDDVVNTLPFKEIKKFFKKIRD